MAQSADGSAGLVTLEWTDGLYYKVELDFTKGSHYETGAAYAAAIVDACPGYEAAVDALLKVSVEGGKDLPDLDTLIANAKELLADMPAGYAEEIAGMGAVFSYDVDELGDGRLSQNELLVFQVVHDVLDPACSACAVYGDSSATGETIVGRNLDWYDLEALSSLHAVTLFNNGENGNSVIGMGFLGQLFTPSSFSGAHVSAAVLDSDMNQGYFSCEGRDAYLADIRYALETEGSVEAVAQYLENHEYTHSFLTILADESVAAVLESDQERPDAAGLRYADSALREGIEWPYADAVAAVNANFLPGTTDNYAGASNELRFASYVSLFGEKLADGGTMDMADVLDVMSYGGTDGVAKSSGAIYRAESDYPSVLSYALNMTTLELAACFGPTPGNPAQPVYIEVFSGDPFTNFWAEAGAVAYS